MQLQVSKFTIHEEKLAYKRFLKLWHRKVEFPDGRVIDWDSVGESSNGPHFCVIFPYDTKTGTVRVIQEYWQGVNEMGFSLAAGGFDGGKHANMRECARRELLEEARLEVSENALVDLVEEMGRVGIEEGGISTREKEEGQGVQDSIKRFGIPELKWSRNRFVPYICIDATPDLEKRAERDAEELIHVCDVTLAEWNQLILAGKVGLTSVQTTLMAVEYLKRNGIIL